MFDNCIIKYVNNIENKKCGIKITYPAVDGKVKIISVPLNELNRHYQEILAWVADGNTIQEAD
jgi:hypothetical protein